MANEQNLIPGNQPGGHTLTQEEQSAGGKASGRKRRLQGAIEKALDSVASSAEFEELFEQFKVDANDKTYSSAIACALVKKASQGNLDAIEMVRDTVGEKPTEDINLNGGVVIIDDLSNPSK